MSSCQFIQIDLEDIQPLKKVRITLEPSGARTTWFLEKVHKCFEHLFSDVFGWKRII